MGGVNHHVRIELTSREPGSGKVPGQVTAGLHQLVAIDDCKRHSDGSLRVNMLFTSFLTEHVM